MPVPKGTKFRVKTFPSGKRVRLAIKNEMVEKYFLDKKTFTQWLEKPQNSFLLKAIIMMLELEDPALIQKGANMVKRKKATVK